MVLISCELTCSLVKFEALLGNVKDSVSFSTSFQMSCRFTKYLNITISLGARGGKYLEKNKEFAQVAEGEGLRASLSEKAHQKKDMHLPEYLM